MIVTSLVAYALALVLATSAAEATPTAVNVRIEGRAQTLFEGPILTEGHAVSSFKADGGDATEDLAEHPCDGINELDPENTQPGPTPTAASVDAMNEIGETQAIAGQWYPGFNDYFVKQWGSEAENAEADGRAWGILVNNVFTDVGGCQHQLNTGDEALWGYNAFEFRPFLALLAPGADYTASERPVTTTARLGKPFELEVLAYEDDQEDAPPAEPERTGAVPIAGVAVAPVLTSAKGFEKLELESPQTVTTNAEGKVSVTFATPGWHRLKAGAAVNAETGEEEAIRSNRLDVCVPPEGASGCGEPLAEDRLRVPPRYRGAIGPEPKNWNAPRITGRAIAGQTVTAGEGLWTGTEPVDYSFRWQRCDSSGSGCDDIPGAATAAYEISAADEGHTLRAIVTAGNVAGSAETESPPTSVVPVPRSPAPPPGPSADTSSSGPGATPAPAGQTLHMTASHDPTRLTVASIGTRRLVLRVSVAGRVTVRIWRRTRHAGKLSWHAFKTLAVKASKAGAITVKLPALSPGSYRLGIALAGSGTVFRVLTVHGR
jgi:hypothetical protein